MCADRKTKNVFNRGRKYCWRTKENQNNGSHLLLIELAKRACFSPFSAPSTCNSVPSRFVFPVKMYPFCSPHSISSPHCTPAVECFFQNFGVILPLAIFFIAVRFAANLAANKIARM